MTRYCDPVMKGGITSGVVHPGAAVELQKEYAIRRLGGTSAGAIAAAAIAAAEHAKRTGQGKGYATIENLPNRLGTDLESLVQPSRLLRPIFGLILGASAQGALRGVLTAPLRTPVAALIGTLPGFALIALAAPKLGAGLAVFTVACGLLLIAIGASPAPPPPSRRGPRASRATTSASAPAPMSRARGTCPR